MELNMITPWGDALNPSIYQIDGQDHMSLVCHTEPERKNGWFVYDFKLSEETVEQAVQKFTEYLCAELKRNPVEFSISEKLSNGRKN